MESKRSSVNRVSDPILNHLLLVRETPPDEETRLAAQEWLQKRSSLSNLDVQEWLDREPILRMLATATTGHTNGSIGTRSSTGDRFSKTGTKETDVEQWLDREPVLLMLATATERIRGRSSLAPTQSKGPKLVHFEDRGHQASTSRPHEPLLEELHRIREPSQKEMDEEPALGWLDTLIQVAKQPREHLEHAANKGANTRQVVEQQILPKLQAFSEEQPKILTTFDDPRLVAQNKQVYETKIRPQLVNLLALRPEEPSRQVHSLKTEPITTTRPVATPAKSVVTPVKHVVTPQGFFGGVTKGLPIQPAEEWRRRAQQLIQEREAWARSQGILIKGLPSLPGVLAAKLLQSPTRASARFQFKEKKTDAKGESWSVIRNKILGTTQHGANIQPEQVAQLLHQYLSYKMEEGKWPRGQIDEIEVFSSTSLPPGTSLPSGKHFWIPSMHYRVLPPPHHGTVDPPTSVSSANGDKETSQEERFRVLLQQLFDRDVQASHSGLASTLGRIFWQDMDPSPGTPGHFKTPKEFKIVSSDMSLKLLSSEERKQQKREKEAARKRAERARKKAISTEDELKAHRAKEAARKSAARAKEKEQKASKKPDPSASRPGLDLLFHNGPQSAQKKGLQATPVLNQAGAKPFVFHLVEPSDLDI